MLASGTPVAAQWDIDDRFGDGGTGIAPDGASGPANRKQQCLRDILRNIRGGGDVTGTARYEVAALAATFTAAIMIGGTPVSKGGVLKQFLVTLGQIAFAVGESVVIDVKKKTGGVAAASLLTGTFTVNSTNGLVAASLDETALLAVAAAVAAGDELQVTGTYTAGGGPAHPNLSIVLIWQ